MNQTILDVSHSRCRSVLLAIWVATVLLCSQPTVGQDAAAELRAEVIKLNYWIQDSPHAPGWRRYLLLNELETQAALGNRASLSSLHRIARQFDSGVSGLGHPVFQSVGSSLHRQINSLTGSRTAAMDQLLQQARYQFHKADANVYLVQRTAAIEDLNALRQHYQSTLGSGEQKIVLEQLAWDEMIEFLNETQFEPAPEVSSGKIESMIRDVRSELGQIEEKIDAMPISPQPDDEPESETPADGDPPGGLQLSPPSPTASPLPLLYIGPQEDKTEHSLKELEKRKKLLEEKRTALTKQRREVLKQDRPRLKRRIAAVRKFRELEKAFTDAQTTNDDPYLMIAKASFEKLSQTFFYGTSGNLQEDMLTRIESVDKQLQKINLNPLDRTANGQLGDAVRWLEGAGQAQPLVTAIRTKYSKPNAYFSINNQLVNRLASQPVSRRQPVRQTVLGRLTQGYSQTDGSVTVRLFDNPHQIQAQLRLDARVSTRTYIQQRRLLVFTHSNGNVVAQRDVYANWGGLLWEQPGVGADFRANLAGTTSRLRLVNRIVKKQFDKSKAEAEQIAANQAKSQVATEFNQQTLEPLVKARMSLREARKKAYAKTSLLPAAYLRTTFNRIHAIIQRDTSATLAAPGYPVDFGIQPEISVRIHESLLSNYLDPLFRGKTLDSQQLADTLADYTGEAPASLTGENAQGDASEDFSISFSRIRPVQFEFQNQQLRVVISGRGFAQGDQKINAGLRIILAFKIVNANGTMELRRAGKVQFEFIDPDRTTPKLVAFRRFLDERLNGAMDSNETLTKLPPNLLPLETFPQLAEGPLAPKLRLVQLRFSGGWAYLGWNFEQHPGGRWSWIYDLSAVAN